MYLFTEEKTHPEFSLPMDISTQVQLEKCWLYLMIHPAELQSDCMSTICLIVLTGHQPRDPQFSSPLNYLTKEQIYAY